MQATISKEPAEMMKPCKKGVFMHDESLLYLGFNMRRPGSLGRRTTSENTSLTTVSEGIGSIRFCGIATFTGLNDTNTTVMVMTGTEPVTASKSYEYCIKCYLLALLNIAKLLSSELYLRDIIMPDSFRCEFA